MPDKKTEKQNHSIICGWGKIGKAIARHLKTEEQAFVIVEHDESKVERMVEAGLSVIAGDARQEDVLEKAGIKSARSLYTTMDDSSNAFVTLTAKLMNPEISVVSKSDDTSHNMEKLKRAGADEIVACHDVGARAMVRRGVSGRSPDTRQSEERPGTAPESKKGGASL